MTKEFILQQNINCLDESIEIVKSIISNYDSNFIKNLGYEDIVRKILFQIKDTGSIEIECLKDFAQMYNERNNKHLITEEAIFKKWTFPWLINIFKGEKNIKKNTEAYDNAEKELVEEFTVISKMIINYINEISKLNTVLTNESAKLLTEKVFNYNSIIEELREILDDLNKLKDLENQHIDEENKLEKNEEIEKVEADKAYSELLISKVFSDNIFNIFVNYCNENQLTTVGQLENFNFDELKKLRGFGVVKKEKLIKRYNEVIGGSYIS